MVGEWIARWFARVRRRRKRRRFVSPSRWIGLDDRQGWYHHGPVGRGDDGQDRPQSWRAVPRPDQRTRRAGVRAEGCTRDTATENDPLEAVTGSSQRQRISR